MTVSTRTSDGDGLRDDPPAGLLRPVEGGRVLPERQSSYARRDCLGCVDDPRALFGGTVESGRARVS